VCCVLCAVCGVIVSGVGVCMRVSMCASASLCPSVLIASPPLPSPPPQAYATNLLNIVFQGAAFLAVCSSTAVLLVVPVPVHPGADANA
jgi:hypothetical protein